MPTPSGQYQLQDYLTELRARGFDGFSTADLTTYVNRGYSHVARKSQWYWEETTDTFTVAPGSASVSLATELPNFRSLDRLYVTTAGQERPLTPMSDQEFFDNWLSADLTATKNRGEPDSYYLWNNNLYILSPPQSSRTFIAYYHQRVTPLVNPTDSPITPQHLDEGILIAALIRCHKRANEIGLAQMAQADLEEFFDDMRDDEEMLMANQPERILPDDTWL